MLSLASDSCSFATHMPPQFESQYIWIYLNNDTIATIVSSSYMAFLQHTQRTCVHGTSVLTLPLCPLVFINICFLLQAHSICLCILLSFEIQITQTLTTFHHLAATLHLIASSDSSDLRPCIHYQCQINLKVLPPPNRKRPWKLPSKCVDNTQDWPCHSSTENAWALTSHTAWKAAGCWESFRRKVGSFMPSSQEALWQIAISRCKTWTNQKKSLESPMQSAATSSPNAAPDHRDVKIWGHDFNYVPNLWLEDLVIPPLKMLGPWPLMQPGRLQDVEKATSGKWVLLCQAVKKRFDKLR